MVAPRVVVGGFVAGCLAVLVFHQGALLALPVLAQAPPGGPPPSPPADDGDDGDHDGMGRRPEPRQPRLPPTTGSLRLAQSHAGRRTGQGRLAAGQLVTIVSQRRVDHPGAKGDADESVNPDFGVAWSMT